MQRDDMLPADCGGSTSVHRWICCSHSSGGLGAACLAGPGGTDRQTDILQARRQGGVPPYGGEHNNCPNDHILPHIHVHLVTDMTWCGSGNSSSGMNQWLVFLRVIQFTWHLRRRHPSQCLSSCHSRQHCHDASPQHHHQQQQQVSASSWTLHLSRQRLPQRVACRRLAVTNCHWGTAARPARRCCDTRSQSGRPAESPARPRRRATWRRRGTQTGDTDCTS